LIEPIKGFKIAYGLLNEALDTYYVANNNNTLHIEKKYTAALEAIRDLKAQVAAILKNAEGENDLEGQAERDGLTEDLRTRMREASDLVGEYRKDADSLKDALNFYLVGFSGADLYLERWIVRAKARAEKRASPEILFATFVLSVLTLFGVDLLRVSDLGLYYAVFMVLPVLLAYLAVVHIILLGLLKRGYLKNARLLVLHSFSHVLLPLCVLALFSIVISESDVLSIALSAMGLSVIVFEMALIFFRNPIATLSSTLSRIYKLDKKSSGWVQGLFASFIIGFFGYNLAQSRDWMTIFPREHISVIGILLSAIAVTETRIMKRSVIRMSGWAIFFFIVLGAIIHYTKQTSIILRAPDVMDIREKLAKHVS